MSLDSDTKKFLEGIAPEQYKRHEHELERTFRSVFYSGVPYEDAYRKIGELNGGPHDPPAYFEDMNERDKRAYMEDVVRSLRQYLRDEGGIDDFFDDLVDELWGYSHAS